MTDKKSILIRKKNNWAISRRPDQFRQCSPKRQSQMRVCCAIDGEIQKPGHRCEMRSLRIFLVFLCSFVLPAVGVSLAANASFSKKSSTKPTSKMAAKNNTAQKKAAQPAKKSSAKNKEHALASAEELSGTIGFVGPSDKEITLIGANGVPYDFQLSRTTKVDLAGKKIGATGLVQESHKRATIRFLPTAQGNLAKSVDISG
jgi:hypothetical protein